MLTAQQRDQLLTDDVRFLMQKIAEAGGETRLVGGAVRDVIMGRSIGDRDFAVNLPPQRVTEFFVQQGVKVVPTGLDHGTVTVVINGHGYELTSLRRDVATDGRHAEIAYTNDWQEDAARRDFTINALYVDAQGQLYDYWGGVEDCAAGVVRFIGDAETRIREDVLRILRFYRFTAWFSENALDHDGQVACAALAHLVPDLSVERVWRELSKLLSAPNPLRTCYAMQASGVLEILLPAVPEDLMVLSRLVQLEQKYSVQPSALRRLAALQSADQLPETAASLKFSNKEKGSLAALVAAYQQVAGDRSVLFAGIIYFCGVEAARDAALLAAAGVGNDEEEWLEGYLHQCGEWNNPIFPLTGKDLQVMGIAPGPEMGRILKQVELWWIARNFVPGRDECVDEVRRLLS